MKKISNIKSDTKKNKKVHKGKNYNAITGFTLTELLATIVVLSLVFTIVIYAAINVVGNAKENSYKVTISNIESNASSYALEDNSMLRWINENGYQYKCIKVQNLIDTGYFKSDVLESYVSETQKVMANNYIYVERDTDSKTITRNVLLVNDKLNVYGGLCGNISTEGNISFVVEPTGWSTSKDIKIYYDVYNNLDRVSNYRYSYEYGDNSKNGNFDKLSEIEELTVDKNGTLYATIKNKDGKTVTNKTLLINKVDVEDPKAGISSTNNVASEQIATLNMSDDAGVVAYYFGKSNPLTSTVKWNVVEETKSKQITANVNSSGIWYLAVKDVVGKITVVNKQFYETTLTVSNATVNPTKIITMSGNTFTIPNATADAYYTFNGWYTTSNFSGSSITTHTPSGNVTIYGKTTENKLTGGSIKISGTNTYGNTLTTQLTETTPKADKYEYQWYYNSSNSVSGGTKISGATSSTYTIGSGLVGKYIYVVVTATKNNYRTSTFSNITDSSNSTVTVAKRKITVTASSSSREYNGSPLTSSSCSGNSLVTGNTLSCTMTSGSTITNVGSVDNVINTVVIKSGSTDVTSNYEITKVNGKLTITRKSVTIPIVDTYCKKSLIYNGSSQTLTNAAGTGYTFSGNTATNAGSHTVTAILNGNYRWSDGTTGNKTFSCSIDKGTPTMTVSPASLSLIMPTAKTFTYTYNGDGALSCSSSNTGVAKCSVNTSNKNVTVIPVNNGSATITLNGDAGTNYTAISKTVSVSVVSNYTVSYNANGGTGAPSSQTKTYGVNLTLSSTKPTREGHTFQGWGTSASDTSVDYNPGGSYTANSAITLYAIWKIDTYTVSYNANGGTGAPSSQTKTYGVNLTLSSTKPTREGHTFQGWGTSASDTSVDYNPGATYTSNSGKTLYAIWKIDTYTVSYNANGGSGAPSSQTKTYGVNLTLSSTKPTREGHTFQGWGTSSSDTSVDYNPGATYTSNSGKTLYAIWKIDTYTVSYNANGGSGAPSSQTKTYNQTLTLSSTKPTRSGYDFQGWGISSSDTSVDYNPGGSYTANSAITLYAIWQTNTYTVSYNANGGSGAPGSQEKTHGVNLTLSSTQPTRSYYVFQGWGISASDTSVYYNPGGSYTANSAITLYAIWKVHEHKWTAIGTKLFDFGGPSPFTCGHDHAHAYAIYCSICGMSSSYYSHTLGGTRDGNYVCPCGWGGKDTYFNDTGFYGTSTVNDFGGGLYGKDLLGKTTAPSSVCSEHTYTVSYNANGGSGGPSAQTKTHGTNLTLSSVVPTRTGYDFSSWNTSSDGTGTSYSKGGTYTSNSAVTLYAQWSKKTYTISYNANGGSGAPSSQTKTYGVNLTLSSTKPTRAGHDFQGWGTTASDTSVDYNPGATYTLNSGKTLYAIWKAKTYTISYNANGGSGAPSSQTKTYGVNLTLSSTKPTKTGYNFQGWGTTASDTSVDYNPGAAYTLNSGKTLYAIWKAAVYTITLNNQSATTAGTSYIYLKYGSGLYTNSSATTSFSSITKPTKNKIFLGVKTGTYTFGGYYTSTSCGGTQMINASGSKTSNFTNTKYSSNTTLYACWK